jgi:hypothetical protein
MHLAYLILAHNNPKQLGRMVKSLCCSFASIFIHLDAKVEDASPFISAAGGFKNVRFVERRIPVNWGAFSMVQATLNGIEEILQSGCSPDYINLLSGTDYPIKSSEYILNFFSENNGKEFLYYRQSPTPDLPDGGMDRIEYYYDYDNDNFDKNLYEYAMRERGVKRKFIEGMVPYHGSQWWSITGSCARHVLSFVNNNREIINFYRYTKFSDEQFFQTVILNSEFACKVVNDNLRYIDWSAFNWEQIDWVQSIPHLKVLNVRDKDFEKILRSDKLFARKFDENIVDEILNLIDACVLKRPVTLNGLTE